MKSKNKSKPNELIARHRIPLYGTHFEVIVTDDIEESCRTIQDKAGIDGDLGEVDGCSIHFGNVFALLICHQVPVRHNTICHELLHITARMMQWSGVKYDPDNHEAFCYLQGFLGGLVYRDLKLWKVKVY